jgi:glutathione S-transferase/maleylpyruvate isomerase
MLTVYSVPISLYCAKLRIILRHKGLEWREESPPGGYGSKEYKKVVATGNLPALLDGRLLIADSEAIAEYLEEKHPKPNMLPNNLDERAKARQLSRFHDTRLEPELRKLFSQIPLRKPDHNILQKQTEEINQRLDQLSNIIEILPDSLLLAHCAFPITFSWVEALTSLFSMQISWPSKILTWNEKLKTFSAVDTELVDYNPKLKSWLRNQHAT